MFGSPFSWTQEYIDNVQHLQKDGWYWKILTPHKFKSKGNVEIIPMNIDSFNDLVEKKLGVRPKLFLTAKKIPSVHITDFYVFSGVLFDELLKDADFWGITNMDVVYGRLSTFFTDEVLSNCDIFSDDVNAINGVFSLFRNTPFVNKLYEKLEWKEVLSQAPCKGCLGIGAHTLFGSDEYGMTEIMRSLKNKIRFRYPIYYPMLSHDRLENHVPNIKLSIKPDGSLWELLGDVAPPAWIHSRPFIGREIPYFHFQRTKAWPNIAL